eukprot:1017861-Ditylum_brightwellii.AAC.2
MIGELRQCSCDKRRKKNIPIQVWDFFLIFIAAVFSMTWNNKTGQTGVEALTGDTPNISE